MGIFYLILPQPTDNLVRNASFEGGTSLWNKTNYLSFGRSSRKTYFGAYSAEFVPASIGTECGISTTCTVPSGMNKLILSAYIQGVPGVTYLLYWMIGGTIMASTSIQGNNAWQRVSVFGFRGASASLVQTATIFITRTTSNTALLNVPFYIDGVQFEPADTYANNVPTTFCDGNQVGCTWTGIPNLSASYRSDAVRSGGVKMDLSEYGAQLMVQNNTGMAPVHVATASLGSFGGSFFERQVPVSRTFTITFSVQSQTGSMSNFHFLRQTLINLFRPDAVYPIQPFIIGYQGGDGNTIEIEALYVSGLDGQNISQEGEEIAIQCVAPDPYWYTTQSTGISCNTVSALSSTYTIIRSRFGLREIQNPLGAVVKSATILNNGTYLLAGGFSSGSFQRTALWDPEKAALTGNGLSAMGSYGFNNTVNMVLNAYNGYIYAIGDFTQFSSGVSAPYFAYSTYFNGTPTAWGAVSPSAGPNGPLRQIITRPQWDSICILGDFTIWNGYSAGKVVFGSATNGISFAPFALKLSGTVNGMVATYHPFIIFYGNAFTTTGNGASTFHIALADTNTVNSTGTVYPLGSGTGPNAEVKGVVVDRQQMVYAIGSFTNVDGIPCSYVASFDGYQWKPVGALDAAPTHIFLLADGTVGVYGPYTKSGNLPCMGIAFWNGHEFVPSGFVPSAAIDNLIVMEDGTELYNFTASAIVNAPISTLVINAGSADVYPRIIIENNGSSVGRIDQIINETTITRLRLNLNVVSGEIVTIDLDQEKPNVTSSVFGDISESVLSGSDFMNFRLLSGDNTISLYSTGVLPDVITLSWRPRHWSIDGSSVLAT